MQILKRALLVLIVPFFSLILFLLAIDYSVVHTAGDPKFIKNLLAENKVYESIIPKLLDQANESAIREDRGGEFSLGDPAVHAAAKEAFSPQFVKSTTETVIDSVYRWLEGKTPVPDFRIDLTQTKVIFAGAAAQKAQQRAGTLPACPRGTQPSSSDPFKAECLPRGATPAAVGETARAEVLNHPKFLKDPIITANTIKAKGSNQSVFAGQWADVPDKYQMFKASPVLLAFLASALAAAIIFLSKTRLKGLRHVGIVMLVAGLGLLVLSWGANKAVNEQVPKLKLDNGVLRDNIHTLIKDVAQNLNGNFTVFGGVYTALGAAAIVGSVFGHRRGHKELKTVTEHESTPVKETPEATQEPPKSQKKTPKNG